MNYTYWVFPKFFVYIVSMYPSCFFPSQYFVLTIDLSQSGDLTFLRLQGPQVHYSPTGKSIILYLNYVPAFYMTATEMEHYTLSEYLYSIIISLFSHKGMSWINFLHFTFSSNFHDKFIYIISLLQDSKHKTEIV